MDPLSLYNPTAAQPPAPTEPMPSPPALSDEKVIAFLKVSTDAYWHTVRVLDKHRALETELKRTKKNISSIVKSIKDAFPAARDVFDDISMESIDKSRKGIEWPLEVEAV